MHPLLDRRDITAQRNAAALGGPTLPHDELSATLRELQATTQLLQHLLLQDRSQIPQLCVTDREPAQAIMENFPVPGARRFVIRRPGAGGTFTCAAGAPTVVAQAAENRLGGELVNTGAAAITLFLSQDLEGITGTPLTNGTAQIGLASGGSWDFRLSNALWCGSVQVIAAAGGSTVTVAEV